MPLQITSIRNQESEVGLQELVPVERHSPSSGLLVTTPAPVVIATAVSPMLIVAVMLKVEEVVGAGKASSRWGSA